MPEKGISIRLIVIVAVAAAMLALVAFLLLQSAGGDEQADLPTVGSEIVQPPLPTIFNPTATRRITPQTAVADRIQPTEEIAEDTPTVILDEPTPPTPGPDALLHTVEPGENLFRISLFYNVPIEDILAANGLDDARAVIGGQVLIIPTSEAPSQPTAPVAEAPVAGTSTPTRTPTPLPPPPPTNINGIPVDSIVVMSEEIIANARQIFARGQELGINPRAFSKVGDSTIENPHFLTRFDEGTYELGDYAYLEPAIDYFQGSFARQGVAVKRGFHSWTVTDPMWADKELCEPNETPVACEIRLNRPAILLIRLGSNDAGVPGSFDFNVRQVVDYAIDSGVLPVIGTKADRFEGEGNINNDILRQIAVDYKLPLWDFDLVSATIPNRGLYENDVHLTIFFPHDYTLARAFQTGHGVHNLTALMMLKAILDEVIEPASE